MCNQCILHPLPCTVECLPGEYPAPTTELMGGSVLYAYPSCTQCPRGHYQSVDGQPHCNPCTPGHHQPSTGQTTCEPCAVGYYQMLSGQNYCLQCPEGTITERIGATSCRGVWIMFYNVVHVGSSKYSTACLVKIPCYPYLLKNEVIPVRHLTHAIQKGAIRWHNYKNASLIHAA